MLALLAASKLTHTHAQHVHSRLASCLSRHARDWSHDKPFLHLHGLKTSSVPSKAQVPAAHLLHQHLQQQSSYATLVPSQPSNPLTAALASNSTNAITSQDHQGRAGRHFNPVEPQLASREGLETQSTSLQDAPLIDYGNSAQFPWKSKLDDVLKGTFGIESLRLCQEGVLNAVLDNRDVVCTLPNGAGKSVCFQAPALMSEGVTVVISPLLALIEDQVESLKAKGVKAIMVTKSTPQERIERIAKRMLAKDGDGVKLCYVTPEKLANSLALRDALEQFHAAGLLSRIVIDEAQCCSDEGRRDRSDYEQLSKLKQLYPKIPIVAFTDIGSKTVFNDIVELLQLEEPTLVQLAEPEKTVFFSAPLYKPNLRYSVRSKPTQEKTLARYMAETIEEFYPGSTGIIYCSSKSKVESFYRYIQAYLLQGTVGMYHAGMSDGAKEKLSNKWKQGDIKCMVATKSFAMGIDVPHVRYVFHHTLSQNMEAYYQETARAGRDGRTSDCILWFRPSDISRLPRATTHDEDSQKQFHQMLKYATNHSTCRKILFESQLGDPTTNITPFAGKDQNVCGQCDNCLRNGDSKPTSFESDSEELSPAIIDMKTSGDPLLEASLKGRKELVTSYVKGSERVFEDQAIIGMLVCEIIEAAASLDFRLTFQRAVQLCRGRHEDAREQKAVYKLLKRDGFVGISSPELEDIMLELILLGYLKENPVKNCFTTNTYIVPGPESSKLTATDPSTGKKQQRPRIEVSVIQKHS